MKQALTGFWRIAILGLSLNAGNIVFGDEDDEVIYFNDFEKKDDINAAPGTDTATHKINFKGLSDEQAHSGKTSCKLDFTVTGGHYCYWKTNLNIPLTNDITFSGYLFRSGEAKCVAFLGILVVYPKAKKNDEGKYVVMSPNWHLSAVAGVSPNRWCQFFGDNKNIYERARNMALKQGWDDTGMYISGWYVHVEGSAKTWQDREQRIVVHVDDVSFNREEVEEEEEE